MHVRTLRGLGSSDAVIPTDSQSGMFSCAPWTSCFWQEVDNLFKGKVEMAPTAEEQAALNTIPEPVPTYPQVPEMAYNAGGLPSPGQTPQSEMLSTAAPPVTQGVEEAPGGDLTECTTILGICTSTFLWIAGGIAAAVFILPMLSSPKRK